MTPPGESHGPERRLAAVWFADIVGYTALSARDEDGALEVVDRFQSLARELVPLHGGRLVKFIGDAALAEFASTDAALRSAFELLDAFQSDEAVSPYGSTLRIGVHVGEVIGAPDGDIYGDGVNLASRLQHEARPAQVVASDTVQAQIRQRPVFSVRPLESRSVKGISGPVQLYAVTLADAPITPPRTPRAKEGSYLSRSRAIAVGLTVALVAFGAMGVWSAFVDEGDSALVHEQITFSGTAQAPAFSPDGSALAFVQDANEYGGDLTLMDSARGHRIAREVSDFVWLSSGELVWASPGSDATWRGSPGDSAVEVDPRPWRRFVEHPAALGVTRIIEAPGGSAIVAEDLDSGRRDTLIHATAGTRIRQAAWSPDGRWLAAGIVDADGTPALALYPREGGEPRRLVEGDVASPRWNAGGDALFYLGSVDGTPGVVRLEMNPRTGEARDEPALALTGFDVAAFDLAPDGRMAYLRTYERSNVWGLDVSEAGTVADLWQATRGTAPVQSVALSPDGGRLAFVRNGDLHLSDASGRSEQTLTALGREMSGVRWSPDGRRLAVVSRTDQGRVLTVVSAEGGSPRDVPLAVPLPRDIDPVLTWGADDASVLYVGADSLGWPSVLARLDLVTEDAEVVYQRDEADVTGAFLGAATSPDGLRVALTNAFGGLLVVSLEDGSVTESYAEVPGYPVLWREDGTLILRSLLDRQELWSVSPDGRSADRMVRLPVQCGTVSLSADGGRVACSVATVERDVWVVRGLDGG